ncbi:uncharacterized protein KY384_001550 [Bacidia gigantensis]|uniref:uncharacterized protein n=1 Tax=Bacidia gigantensis TaxID=2732470 RepID=UPI001D04DE3D|nr:uncharacterized protein KY384_001550 [Bacidia gigantensis]KAG8533809.1 hypothetical protein KY384_001550 [Bacidia gigantensis]
MADADGSSSAMAASQLTDPRSDNLQDKNLTSSAPHDPTASKRPRDARLIHMILAQYGVTAYQERVPLQLMDFAYRYTSSTLQDALHLSNEGYGNAGSGIGTSTGGGKSGAEGNTLNLAALRLAIHSTSHYQYNPSLPKEFYMNLAQEKNKIGLPSVQKEWGMKLPPEQYLLTGQHWEMAEEFDMIDGEEMGNRDMSMRDQEDADQGDGEVEGGTMEDIFGSGGDGAANEGDDRMLE